MSKFIPMFVVTAIGAMFAAEPALAQDADTLSGLAAGGKGLGGGIAAGIDVGDSPLQVRLVYLSTRKISKCGILGGIAVWIMQAFDKNVYHDKNVCHEKKGPP